MHDHISDLTGCAVQNVPIRQDTGRPRRLVEDDGAEGARRAIWMADASPRRYRIHPGFENGCGAWFDDCIGRSVVPLNHVGGHREAVRLDPFGQGGGPDRLQCRRLYLFPDRENDADIAIPILPANADRRHIRIPQILGTPGSDEVAQGLHQVLVFGGFLRSRRLCHIGSSCAMERDQS
ncbi:hypothetical protein V8J82_22025 [Gymnodinialimonas sp. 2305UL16-5]|uniref:hypothetical protein n=1 Tax=Gymnodinialimonas mytili TaxID=3126503 RepID=UPI0030B42325